MIASTLQLTNIEQPSPRRAHRLRVALVTSLFSLLAACGGSEDAKNDPVTPPVVVTQAAAKVWDLSRAMGPGINFGNMLEAPNEGEWGLSVKPENILLSSAGKLRILSSWSVPLREGLLVDPKKNPLCSPEEL